MALRKFLSEHEQKEIEARIHEVEKHTQGELVPVIVEQSSNYESRIFQFITSSFVILSYFIFHSLQYLREYLEWVDLYPSIFRGLEIFIYLLAGFLYILGSFFLLKKTPFLLKKLLRSREMNACVRKRAEEAFFDYKLHKTRHESGILVFVSLLERHVELLADKGISSRVPHEAWQKIVDNFAQKIKAHHLKDGLLEVIDECGKLLKEHFPAKDGEHNPDELPNTIAFEKEE